MNSDMCDWFYKNTLCFLSTICLMYKTILAKWNLTGSTAFKDSLRWQFSSFIYTRKHLNDETCALCKPSCGDFRHLTGPGDVNSVFQLLSAPALTIYTPFQRNHCRKIRAGPLALCSEVMQMPLLGSLVGHFSYMILADTNYIVYFKRKSQIEEQIGTALKTSTQG